MTALAGFWSLASGRHPRDACARMLQAQEIYGPGVPAVVVEGGLALGRRLFRTVPEDQFDRGPATSVSGRWTMVADIRLDNRSDLCTALGLEDEAAASLADSSILL